MNINISKEQAQLLGSITSVIEWKLLSKKAQNELTRLGISKEDFDKLMYDLYDDLWICD